MVNYRELVGVFTVKSYFTLVLALFLASYVFLPSSKAVNNFFYVFFALPGLFFLLRSPWPKTHMTALGWLWVLFFCSLILGWFNVGGFQYIKHWLYVLLFFLIVVRFVDFNLFRRFEFLSFCFLLFLLYVCFFAFYYWVTGVSSVGARVTGLPMRLSVPTYTSMFLVAFLSSVGVLLVRRGNWGVLFFCFSVVFFCAGYILQSRSGLVGLFVFAGVAFLCFLIHNGRSLVRFLGVSSLIAFSLILVWLFSNDPVFERLLERADAGRFELWSAYYQSFLKCNTWLGCSPDQLSGVTIRNGSVLIEHPHNVFLSILFYNGWAALFFFVLIVIVTLKYALLQRNPWGAFLGVSLLMLMFDGNRLINQPNELWVLVLLPCALIMAEVVGKTEVSKRIS